ncbi:MAG: CDP-archaeol synthase [Nitrospirales bacterium]|nr:CDP-archaeol synthase [Nitrospirales bacterium]
MVYLQLLIVVIAANGAPILGRLLMKNFWSDPLDLGTRFIDGRPLLGSSKTFRGVIFGVVTAGLFAEVVALPFEVGILVGALAMCGDLASSFVKRRFGLQSEAMALGLDQIPESVIPLIGVKSIFELSWRGIGLTVGAFLVLELLLSILLFKLHIRKHPY